MNNNIVAINTTAFLSDKLFRAAQRNSANEAAALLQKLLVQPPLPDKLARSRTLGRAIDVACRNDCAETISSLWTCLNEADEHGESEEKFWHGCYCCAVDFDPLEIRGDVRHRATLGVFRKVLAHNSMNALEVFMKLRRPLPRKNQERKDQEQSDQERGQQELLSKNAANNKNDANGTKRSNIAWSTEPLLDVDAFDGSSSSALFYACAYGRAGAARLLLEAKARVDVGFMGSVGSYPGWVARRWEEDGECSWSPLHEAANVGSAACVSVLIAARANVNARYDPDDLSNDHRYLAMCTPLHIAVWGGHARAVNVLLRAKADLDRVCQINTSPFERQTPLLLAHRALGVCETIIRESFGDHVRDWKEATERKEHCEAVASLRDICRQLEEAERKRLQEALIQQQVNGLRSLH
jgi:ankyrin repeat protein